MHVRRSTCLRDSTLRPLARKPSVYMSCMRNMSARAVGKNVPTRRSYERHAHANGRTPRAIVCRRCAGARQANRAARGDPS